MRLWTVGFFLLLLYGAIVWRMYGLQMRENEYYAARAASQYGSSVAPRAPRNTIYVADKHGNRIPLAMNKPMKGIFAVPRDIEDVEEASARLAALLGLDVDRVQTMLERKNAQYALLVPRATDEQLRAIEEAAINGVAVEETDRRYYPFGKLAAHVVGFVGVTDDGGEEGRYGIESAFEKKLENNAVQLTLDRNIQAQAEEILENLVAKFGAIGGTIIVEEPATGKILAMANAPTFDPNNYGKYDLKNFLNPAVQAIYEPGSIFKVITMASALDAKKITPETTFYDTGSLTLNGKTIKNWDNKGHGRITMINVIEESINTGAAFAERALGHSQFYQYLLDFGFNEKTGIELGGEVKGSLRPLQKNVQDINFATASYGQGVSVTPLALANAVAAIGNGGTLMKPYVTNDERPSIVRRVITKEAAAQVTAMMVSAVDKAGVAKIEGYRIAGKTGTAQIPDFKNGGYTHDVVNTYVGYAPANEPKFLIVVKLDKPKDAPLAGTTVVPAFRELAEFMINYLQIPPDRE